MRRNTIKCARTWRWARMRPWVARSSGPVSLSPFRSCPGCTTNTFGYDFRKGQLFAALVCVFVIRIIIDGEASGVLGGTGLGHYSTECSCSDASDAIRIMHVSGKEEFRIAVSDGNLVRLCESVGNVREWKTDAGRQADVALFDIFKLRRDRQRSSVLDNEKIHSVFKNVGVACAAIDARYLPDNGSVVHKFADQPHMLETNFWSVCGQKVFAGKPDLLLVSLPQFVSASFQRESEGSDKNGRQRGPELRVSHTVHGFQERDVQ